MNPTGAILTLIFSLFVLLVPRRWAALGVMGAVCYLTQGQQVNVLGFHFTAIRIVLLAGTIRSMMRGDYTRIALNGIDKVLVAYVVVMMAVYTMRIGTFEALVYQFGCAYDVVLSYFAFRCLISDMQELEDFLSGAAILIVPFALLMATEAITGKNVFRSLGGFEPDSLWVRGDRFRCVGSFRSPITAGTFGFMFMPLFVGLLARTRHRTVAVFGLIAATAIMATSNSSGPLLAYLAGLAGLACWPFREKMRIVRWGIVGFLLAAHLTMKAPVWYLLTRVGDLFGGHAWWRSYVIDVTVSHFSDWWLMGSSKPAAWFEAQTLLTDDATDLTNQYVVAAANGGLAALLLLVLLIVRCFRHLGQAMETVKQNPETSEWILWCLGAGLLEHVINFFSVSYFDQVQVALWALLAIISSATSNVLTQSATPVSEDSADDVSEARPYSA